MVHRRSRRFTIWKKNEFPLVNFFLCLSVHRLASLTGTVYCFRDKIWTAASYCVTASHLCFLHTRWMNEPVGINSWCQVILLCHQNDTLPWKYSASVFIFFHAVKSCPKYSQSVAKLSSWFLNKISLLEMLNLEFLNCIQSRCSVCFKLCVSQIYMELYQSPGGMVRNGPPLAQCAFLHTDGLIACSRC